MAVNIWRLIESDSARGAINMATDEALLLVMEQNPGEPVLRLYSWETPTLSLGYRQSLLIEEWNALKEGKQLNLVRRPTGGGAVLHDRELTYAVIISRQDHLIGSTPKEAYYLINSAISTGLAILGIRTDTKPHSKTSSHFHNNILAKEESFLCFQNYSISDITVNYKKLVGSAQMRKRNTFLQHGSILLAPYSIPQNNSYCAEKNRTNISAILNKKTTTRTVKEAIKSGFETVFNCTFYNSKLTNQENKIKEELIKNKYENPGWLFR